MRVYKVGPSACTCTHSGRSTWGVTYVSCSSDISFVGDEKLTNICFLVEGTSQKRCVSFLQRTDTVSTIQPSQDPHTVQPSPDPTPSNLHKTPYHPTFTRPHTIQPSQDPHTIHCYNHVLISPHSLPPGPNHNSPSSSSTT